MTSGIFLRMRTPAPISEQEFLRRYSGEYWAEWVDGRPLILKPPTLQHAELSAFLFCLLGGFVEELESGSVFRGSYQVRLDTPRRRRSPDLYFVSEAKRHLCHHMEFNGAPDVIVEIVSRDSQVRDREEKFEEYQAAKVREYWLIDPSPGSVKAYSLQNSGKFARVEESAGAIASAVQEGFFVNPVWLWQPTFPKVSALLKDMARRKGGTHVTPLRRRPSS